MSVSEADSLMLSVHFDKPVTSWWVNTDRATDAETVSPPSQLVCEVILCPAQEDTQFPFVSVSRKPLAYRLASCRPEHAHSWPGAGSCTLGYCCLPAVPTLAMWPCARLERAQSLELDRPGFESQFWLTYGLTLLSILVFPSAEREQNLEGL